MLTPTGDMDLRKIGQARNTLMNVKLSQVRLLLVLHLYRKTRIRPTFINLPKSIMLNLKLSCPV